MESSSSDVSQKKSVKTRLAFYEQVREEELQGNSLGVQGKGCKVDGNTHNEKDLGGVFQSSAVFQIQGVFLKLSHVLLCVPAAGEDNYPSAEEYEHPSKAGSERGRAQLLSKGRCSRLLNRNVRNQFLWSDNIRYEQVLVSSQKLECVEG